FRVKAAVNAAKGDGGRALQDRTARQPHAIITGIALIGRCRPLACAGPVKAGGKFMDVVHFSSFSSGLPGRALLLRRGEYVMSHTLSFAVRAGNKGFVDGPC